MILLKSPEAAWHDVSNAREGMQDPYKIEVGRCTKPSDMSGVYEAELAKVARCIESLPKHQRILGGYAFACRHESYKADAVEILWTYYLMEYDLNPDIKSYAKTVKSMILVSVAAEDARFRVNNNGKRLLSHAAVASKMGMSRQSFSGKWSNRYEVLIETFGVVARDALSEVSAVCDEINAAYKWAV